VMNDPYAFYNAAQQQMEIALPLTEDGFTLTVFNNLGQVVHSLSTKNTNEIIGTGTLAAGVYTLQVTNGSTNYSMKFVRE
jgi:hypothetical protein